MNSETVILIAEDDDGHAALIRKNLGRCGIDNPVEHFFDGQQVLDYLSSRYSDGHSAAVKECLLLLDIRMPKIDGIGVLRAIKSDPVLSAIPVIMITTTDDPVEIDNCLALGCSSYMLKPVDHVKFCELMSTFGILCGEGGNICGE